MFGEKLRKCRKERKFTQAALGKLIGVSGAYIQQLELGKKTNPSLAIVFKICEVLKVEPFDLDYDFFDETMKELGFFNKNTSKKIFINEEGKKTIVIPKNNGDITEPEALQGILKYINYIANSLDYVLGGEFYDIVNSVEELIKGKILILKHDRGVDVTQLNSSNILNSKNNE
ncbi:MAG: helix-turn-helix domain-containing protein [Clostridiaceae bacterium]